MCVVQVTVQEPYKGIHVIFHKNDKTLLGRLSSHLYTIHGISVTDHHCQYVQCTRMWLVFYKSMRISQKNRCCVYILWFEVSCVCVVFLPLHLVHVCLPVYLCVCVGQDNGNTIV